MKRRYINLVLAGILSTGMLSSCSEDFLDKEPYTEVKTTDALLTDTDVLTALNGTYSGMHTIDLYGRSIPLLGDLLADNTYVSAKNAGRYLEFEGYFFTRNSGNITNMWSDAYTVILRANNIINSQQSEDSDQEKVAQYKGEAYAIRALMYFELVKFFSEPYTADPGDLGVPIVLESDITAEPTRNTIGEVYEQIQSDLSQAYSLMNSFSNSGRFSKYAARALQAKVNLYMGEGHYDKALEYAEDVIKNSGFSLVKYPDVVDYWSNPITSTNKGETLFEVIATETDNLGTNELGYIYHQDGYGDVLTTADVYDLYSDDDARKDLIIVGARGTTDVPAYIVNKYSNVSGDRDDKKVLRMSEVYLIAAEAAYRLGNEVKALEYLNDLVEQRDPTLVYTSTGAQLLEDIILERRKELAFEGDRLHTLDRLNRDITDRPDGPAVVEFSNFMRVFPIPQAELVANKNITQNPGW